MAVSKHGERLFNRRYLVLMIVSFFISGSFYLVQVSLSAYSVSIGASLTLAGVIIGCFSITALIARPFSGVLVNRMRKKKILMIAVILMLLASAAYSIVRIPVLLIAVRIIHGAGFALNSTVSLVLVSMSVPTERMGEGVSYFGLAQMLASAVMPSLGSWLNNSFGYSSVFVAATGIIFIGGIVLAFLKFDEIEPASVTPEHTDRKPFSFSELICLRLLPFGIIGALFSMFNGINSSFMLQIGTERSIENIALYFTVNTITIVVIRLLLGKLADKISIYYVMIFTAVFSIIAAFVIGIAASLLMILVAAVFQASGQGIAQPSLQSECLKRADPGQRGTASSTYYMCVDIGQGVGAMIGGAIADVYGYDIMYYGIGIIFFVATVVCIGSFISVKRKAAAAS